MDDVRESFPLCEVDPGGRVVIESVEAEGLLRQRLLNLGFVNGTEIEVVRRSPHGDPTAYRLRGAVYALRQQEANLVKASLIRAETRRECALDGKGALAAEHALSSQKRGF